MLEDKCGGNFQYTEHGVKDCSNCIIVHTKDVGFAHVQKKMMTVIEIVMENHLKKASEIDDKESKKLKLQDTFKKREVKFQEDRDKMKEDKE
jgi:Zn-finger protein